jgi:hypothetical protein
MSPTPSNRICPDCEAKLPTEARFCWLCGASVSQLAPDPFDEEAISSIASDHATEPPSKPWIPGHSKPGRTESERFEEPISSPSVFVALLLGLTLMIVLMGVGSESRGLAILLVILIGPPLLVTSLKSAARTSQSRQTSDTLPVGNQTRPAAKSPVTPMTSAEKASTFFKGLLVMLLTVGGIVGLLAICALIALVSMVSALLSICGIH